MKDRPCRRVRIISIILSIFLFLLACGCGNSASAESDVNKQPDKDFAAKLYQNDKDGLEVHFIDVGQGDATLLRCGNQTMLIDAGPDNVGTALQYYLVEQGVERLDYVVITHPDADHIGGMDVILTKFDCEKVFMTEDNPDQETSTYRDLKEALRYKSYKTTVPSVGDKYTLAGATITFLGPAEPASSDNDNSIVCLVNYLDNSFLFTGDAEEAEEQMLIQQGITADVYHVGHHGSETSSGEALLAAVNPTYAVISCGKNNSYGHPHKSVLDRLQKDDVLVFRTDEQGSIVAHSDGNKIEWSTAPSKTWAPGIIPIGFADESNITDAPISRNNTPEKSQDIPLFNTIYVLNTNTKKFHLPSCSSVSEMKEKNRKDVNWSRADIIDSGYEPCKRCNP